MIELSSKANCTGCSACANICPRGCIRMMADEEGFLYPKVNEEMCMDCGLCENVCPMLHKPQQHELLAVYGAKNNDDAVRFTSSSGGMFTLFAEEILKQGGVVVGAALEPRGVVPLVAIEGPQHARGSRRALGLKGIRIGLVELLALVGLDEVFIELALLGARNKALPDSARMHGHQRVGLLIPIVEFTDNVDTLNVGCPNAKAPAACALLRVGMRAHLFPAALPHSNAKQVDIVLGELRCVRGGFTGCGLFSRWL